MFCELESFLKDFEHMLVKANVPLKGGTTSIDLPGYKKEEIEISYEKSTIRVSAKNEKRGVFTRLYEYPYTIGSVEAKMEDGVLELKVSPATSTGGTKVLVT